MPENTHRTLDCPTCGAPLDYDGKSSTVRCKFCNNVTLIEGFQEEKPLETPIKEVRVPPQPKPAQPVIIKAPYKPAAKAATTSGAFLGCGIGLVTLLIVGTVLGLAFSQPGGPFIPRMVAVEPAILIPAGQDTPPDVASLFYNVNDETRLVARVGASNGKLAWQADPLPGDGFAENLVTDGGLIYAASKMHLFAYHAVDGRLAWQVEMPDQLEYSDSSLVLASGRVIAMTIDRSLQAYDAVTGQLVWSRRMFGYDRQIRLVGDQLVVMDYLGDDYTYSLIFLDPADGREDFVLSPACPYTEFSSDTPDPDSGIFFEPDQNSIYLFYDTFTGCIQRMDFSTGQVSWRTTVEEGFSFSPYGFNSFMTGSVIYFGDEERLLRVDKGTGAVQTLLVDEDYNFMPLAISGETLIVRARRSRGSERFELWGLEAGSGERLWSWELENSKPLDPPNEMVGLVDEDVSGWAWHLASNGLLLLEFQAVPNQLVLTTLNPADGTSTSELTIELEKSTSDFYSVPTVIGWWEQVVYFILDAQVYAVDTVSGEVLMVYQ